MSGGGKTIFTCLFLCAAWAPCVDATNATFTCPSDAEATSGIGVDMACRIFLICVCVLQFCFFLYQRIRYNRAGIDTLWVVLAELIVYSMYVATKASGANPAAIVEGCRSVPLLRYASWLVTCPVQLITVSILSARSKDKQHDVMELTVILILDQVMIICGILGKAFGGRSANVNWMCFAIAAACLCSIFRKLAATLKNAHASFPDEAKPYLHVISVCFFVGWPFFPTAWLIEEAGLSTPTIEAVLHVFGDLIAKNLFLAATWTLRWRVLAQKDGGTTRIATKLAMPGESQHIAVVDRDPVYVKLLTHLLESRGHRVASMFSFFHFDVQCKQAPFDLVMMKLDPSLSAHANPDMLDMSCWPAKRIAYYAEDRGQSMMGNIADQALCRFLGITHILVNRLREEEIFDVVSATATVTQRLLKSQTQRYMLQDAPPPLSPRRSCIMPSPPPQISFDNGTRRRPTGDPDESPAAPRRDFGQGNTSLSGAQIAHAEDEAVDKRHAWVKTKDEKRGKYYYHNHETNASQWHPPASVDPTTIPEVSRDGVVVDHSPASSPRVRRVPMVAEEKTANDAAARTQTKEWSMLRQAYLDRAQERAVVWGDTATRASATRTPFSPP